MDNVVDRMRDEAFIMLVKTMNERPEATRQALDALLVARNLERVADHATNIAEDVIFWVRGADVRHNAPQEPNGQEQAVHVGPAKPTSPAIANLQPVSVTDRLSVFEKIVAKRTEVLCVRAFLAVGCS